MPDMALEVRKNRVGVLGRLFPGAVEKAVKTQTVITARRVEHNIIAVRAVDTGRMLGSVRARITGKIGTVTVEAKSDRGFPYPIAQENGWHDRSGRYHAGRYFVRKAMIESEPEFKATMRKEIEAVI